MKPIFAAGRSLLEIIAEYSPRTAEIIGRTANAPRYAMEAGARELRPGEMGTQAGDRAARAMARRLAPAAGSHGEMQLANALRSSATDDAKMAATAISNIR